MKKHLLIAVLGFGFIACTAKKAVVKTNTDVLPELIVAKEEAFIEELTPELVQGKSIYEAKCNKCHDLPSPNSYSKQRWVPIMKSMQNAAKISDEEREMVYNYVTMNL